MRTKEEIQAALNGADNTVLDEAAEELFRLRAKLADREGFGKLLYGMFYFFPGDGWPIEEWPNESKGIKKIYKSRAEKIIEYLTNGEGIQC